MATVRERMVVHKTPRARNPIHRLVRGTAKLVAAVGMVPAATVGDRVSQAQMQAMSLRKMPCCLPTVVLAEAIEAVLEGKEKVGVSALCE